MGKHIECRETRKEVVFLVGMLRIWIKRIILWIGGKKVGFMKYLGWKLSRTC